ncbi:MAG: HAD hydrolase family protein, partial [Actinomycetota bacterium]
MFDRQDLFAVVRSLHRQSLAIGDGANDLLMIEQSGFGVAYKAKPILRKVAALSIEENLA